MNNIKIEQRVMMQLTDQSFHGVVNEVSGCGRWLKISQPHGESVTPFNEWFSLHARNVMIRCV